MRPDSLRATLPDPPGGPAGAGAPLPKSVADELACVAAWLDKEAGRIRVVHADEGLSSAYPALDTYEPRNGVPLPR
jgi:hypothetical protein